MFGTFTSRQWTTIALHITFCFSLIFCLTISQSTAQVDPGQAATDWREAEKLKKEYESGLRWESDFSKDPELYIDKWFSFKKRFDTFWPDFTKRYGIDRMTVRGVFSSVQQPLDVETDIGTIFSVLEEVPNKTPDIVQWSNRIAQDKYREWKRGKDNPPHPHKVELWLDKAEQTLFAFNIAKKIDPKGDYSDNIKLAEAAVKESQALFEQNLTSEEMKWPSNNPDWSGEGNPEELCAAAFDFLKKNPDERGDAYQDDTGEPIAVSLAGKDWEVYKKAPLTHQPTQYSLDFHVAFASKKDSRIAYKYYYSFYTKEEAGVKKAPPFFYANPHQYAHYKMLKSYIPVTKSSSSARPTGSFFGFIFRLFLSLSLIVGGFVAAAAFFKEKFPNVSGLYESLGSYRGQIGVFILIIGILCFLRALFLYFSPMTDLLPQFMAIILGLLLGLEMLIKGPTQDKTEQPEPSENQESASDQVKDKAKEAVHKAQKILIKNQEKISKLEKQQIPIGLVSLALGIIHLLAGGIWLF